VRLTRGVDYGARGAIYLAKQPPETVVLVGDIARYEGLPESYLAKLFQDLSRAGVVRSHRGARGGFSLSRPAAEITLKQIVEAIEGPLALCPCLSPVDNCERRATCGMYPFLCSVQQQMTSMLDGTSLQAIADQEATLLAG
jgi:Rrf2 family iron-sulfur cluster assembly transcriptional regulator